MPCLITKEGKAALEEELRRLNQANGGIRSGMQSIADIRSAGGWHIRQSGNQNAQREADSINRILLRRRELEKTLAMCQVMDPAAVNAGGRCIFGAYVRLRDGAGGEISYRLVGECEANLNLGGLSVTSPTGRALLGKHAGDLVHVFAPGGEVEYKLLEVRYEPPQDKPSEVLGTESVAVDTTDTPPPAPIPEEREMIPDEIPVPSAKAPDEKGDGIWRKIFATLMSLFGRSGRK